MKFTNLIRTISLLGLLEIAGACKDFVEINSDPNNPTTPVLELLLPATQISMAGSLRDVNQGTSIVMQHLYTATASRNFQDGTDYQQSWNALYTQVLNDIEIVIREGTRLQRWDYVSIAKLQKAYLYSIMVDLWGDIPYTDASKGLTVSDPTFESGAAIYDKLFTLIDEGLADANKGNFAIQPTTADIIYKGDKAAWIRMGNSLKLKLFNQIRLVQTDKAKAGIAALLSSNAPLITTNAQDFAFRFGTTETPANRHPWHRTEYQAGKTYYMSQNFIERLFGTDDIRMRYFFFRQTSNYTVGFTPTGNGYFGRYTGDATASPNDNALKATCGVYPAGGLYDNAPINNLTAANVFILNTGATGSPKVVTNSDGSGAGVFPFITNAMVKFILAESALTMGTAGDPKQLFQDGITASLNSINTISTTSGNSAPTMPAASVTSFVASRAAQYDAADATGKLNAVMTQKYIALYGNGMESYNDYRRTGFPVLPAPIAPLNTFPLRLAYSVTELATNASVSEKADQIQTAQQTTPVFWDK
ncbi:SusD/RagB family nutrient-binding outer membrane lipoprotein [Spirosoma sp. BT702]|uniref:SusD/RagB family nutrient-binding outer membrane lipoprotein n=1 Tax=Spirosoma profusum TaxID=2771354 RepID=A0A926Y3J9_9BACT|nr:SusD/RagB family nutrient-binding outer membrane lipoprotein [Spirosoma profusum]MBD2703473.1 SusD/RagB family nutrient-binding outer membrane lipoprotein [Spirosoma profusum]